MRNFDRSGYKSSSNYSHNDRRDDRRSDRYDDKFRNSNNKSFGRNNDFKKPRYDDRHYQGGSDRDRSYRGNDQHSKSDRSFRNVSPPKRSRDRSGYHSNEPRQRNMSPPQNRRSDYRTSSTGIKSRLAPLRSRIANSSASRINRSGGGNKMLRRNDLRGGLVSKRSATINRAKDYARKIRQARMKLNDESVTTRPKSTIETKSQRNDSEESFHKNENAEDDYLAIANDVNFDEDENESTGGKNAAPKEESKAKETKEDDVESNENNKKSVEEESKIDEDQKSARNKESASRSPSKERTRKFDRIEYSCIHCGKKSSSAQEYRSHLNGRRHLLAMREVSLRVRSTLNRLRKVQRDRQLEIEARIKDVETIQSKYCQVCKLNFRQSKEEHRESEDHRKISSFLKPYCKICRMKLISPMKYEIHRCHTDHIRRKLKTQEGSDEEIDIQEMDIGDFKTVDSVGNVDDDGEMNELDFDNENETDGPLGMGKIAKVEAFYCSLCQDFIFDQREKSDEEKMLNDHCKTRRHLNRFHDEERKTKLKAVKESDVSKSPEKSNKQNGKDDKTEKVKNDEVDRDADIDENTTEEKHSDDDS